MVAVFNFVSGMCDRKWKKNCAISADVPCQLVCTMIANISSFLKTEN